MYFVGVLFGLGFETASEVGLLALAAVGPKDVPAPLVMLLPALFTSGMALVDTCDGLLVLFTFAKVKSTRSPSHVSTRAMPDVNNAGKSMTRGAGTSLGPTAAKANSPTSDAVSKPNPNSTPTKYIFRPRPPMPKAACSSRSAQIIHR